MALLMLPYVANDKQKEEKQRLGYPKIIQEIRRVKEELQNHQWRVTQAVYRHLVFIAIVGFFLRGCSSQGYSDWELLFETGKIAIILLFAPFYLTKVVPSKPKTKPLILVN